MLRTIVEDRWIELMAMSWLRYRKRVDLICTECFLMNNCIADVVGATDENIYEIEIKRSMQDLKRDFETKEHKHDVYSMKYRAETILPNYFFFLVPSLLADQAREFLQTKNPKYGLLAFEIAGQWEEPIRSVKPGRRLHEGLPHKYLLSAIRSRMSNEIIALRAKVAGENLAMRTLETMFEKTIEVRAE